MGRRQVGRKQVSSSSASDSQAGIQAQAHHLQGSEGPSRRLLTLVDCRGLCAIRCGRHSRPNVCTRACGTCCRRCNCVPPGTHGNRERCGSCYTDMLTHGNKPKCP
ncbi:Gibberellin regulated protein [Cynara cardunculus var. scolymus]|uniref:Gibberellin regulated protein n=1 Tax=Cynara cardunculus var. scolymus TaxID=59895 RepID=A0A103XSJ5_CYNCS|nr:Gibberellin regulated protein [Cynara cardunculus var. scolymus]